MNERLWVVSSYFNWSLSRRKRDNLEAFRRDLRDKGIPLLLVECAFEDEPYALDPTSCLQVRTRSQMWQKERLLNLAIRALPHSCKVVVWMDCDLLIAQPSWPERVERELEQADIVQVFSTVLRLGPDNSVQSPLTRVDRGILASIKHHGLDVLSSRGHPGFGWAARREFLLDHPLLETAIVGGADKMMLYGWSGFMDSGRTRAMTSTKGFEVFTRWVSALEGGLPQGLRLSFVPGTLHHLWHGASKDRQYNERYEILRRFDFDPEVDLVASEEGCLEFTGNKPEFEEAIAAYFLARREDGS